MIASRIVKEAVSRQVIVFTHDILFFNDLINHTKEHGVDCKTHWMEKFGP